MVRLRPGEWHPAHCDSRDESRSSAQGNRSGTTQASLRASRRFTANAGMAGNRIPEDERAQGRSNTVLLPSLVTRLGRAEAWQSHPEAARDPLRRAGTATEFRARLQRAAW